MKKLHDVSSMEGRSYIVSGGSLNSRKDYIDSFISGSNFETHVLDTTEKNVSVENARTFLSAMDYSTLSHTTHRFFIVYGADTLSIVVQNTLLKRVEELPSRTTFVFECSSAESLLPTIVSRSHVVRLGQENEQSDSLKDLLEMDLAGLFNLAESAGSETQQATALISRLLLFVRSVVSGGSDSPAILRYLEFLLQCHEQILHTNASTRLIIENAVLGFYTLFSPHYDPKK